MGKIILSAIYFLFLRLSYLYPRRADQNDQLVSTAGQGIMGPSGNGVEFSNRRGFPSGKADGTLNETVELTLSQELKI